MYASILLQFSCTQIAFLTKKKSCSPLSNFRFCIVNCTFCHRPSRNATNPSAISSKSALLGSLAPLVVVGGGIFSFPGSSRLTRFPLVVFPIGFRLLPTPVSVVSGAGVSVSSKTTVAFPPIPSPRRIDGVRFRGARLGAQEERQVVSRDGFWMFLVLGERGAWFVFTERGIRRPALTAAGILENWGGGITGPICSGPGVVSVVGTPCFGSRRDN